MARFTNLPNEVLCDVFSDLGQQDLADLCLVSRRLRSVAEPFLYRNVSLSTLPKTVHVFRSFQRTSSSRPALLKCLKSLSLRWDLEPITPWYTPHEITTTPPPFDVWLFGAVVSLFGVRSELPFEAQYIMPLLLLVPRLEVLHLRPPGDLNIFDINLPFADLPRFEFLREVRCRWEQRHTVSYATLMFLLMLPSMRTLEVRFACPMGFPTSAVTPDTRDTCTGMSGVTNLQLSYGFMACETLEKLLRVPRALTHFSYNHIPTSRLPLHAVGVVLERIAGTTLQSLALTIKPTIYPRGWITPIHFPIPSLRYWPVLWSVRSSLAVLLGSTGLNERRTNRHLIDVLPVVIREFEIELDGHWTATEIVAEVVEMLHLKGTGDFDQLTVLTIPVEVHEKARWLGAACDAVGVELVLTRQWK